MPGRGVGKYTVDTASLHNQRKFVCALGEGRSRDSLASKRFHYILFMHMKEIIKDDILSVRVNEPRINVMDFNDESGIRFTRPRDARMMSITHKEGRPANSRKDRWIKVFIETRKSPANNRIDFNCRRIRTCGSMTERILLDRTDVSSRTKIIFQLKRKSEVS